MKQPFFVAGVNGFIEGEGAETLIMIHGWPDTLNLWDKQVEYFKQSYRCVTFTLPGFEHKPEKPQLFTIAEVVNVIASVVDFASPDQPVNLLMHDWGCVYGYQFTLEHPKRVSRIIGVDVGDIFSSNYKKGLSPKEFVLIAGYQIPLATAYRIGGFEGDLMARAMAKVLKVPVSSKAIHANMGYPYYYFWIPNNDDLKTLKPLDFECPVLFIYAKRKPVMFHSRPWAEQLRQNLKNKVIKFDTSHWVMLDEPDQFNQTVFEWLQNSSNTKSTNVISKAV